MPLSTPASPRRLRRHRPPRRCPFLARQRRLLLSRCHLLQLHVEPRTRSRWVAIGVVVLVAAALLVMRPWSSRDASTPAPTPSRRRRTPPCRRIAAARQARSDRTGGTAEGRTSSRRSKRRHRQAACAPTGRHHPGHRAAMPDLLDEWQQLAMRSGRRLRGAGADRPLYACQVPARCRGGASLVSRRHAAAIREADDSGQRDGGLSHLQPADRGRSGDWRVEVRSADGNLLHEQRFAVR